MNQPEIQTMCAALRTQGLTWSQTNFAVALVRNTAAAETEALQERVKVLESALRMAVRQNEHDMLMTGEELRACSKALAKATP